MKYMKRAACLALSAALVASAGIVPLAQAAVPMSASVLEECNSVETPTVESVTALIAQIGDVTLKSGEKINAAATAYARLDEESRALVPNVAVLIEAQQVFELEQALDQLYIKRDDVEGKTVIAPNKDLVNIRSATVLPCFIYSDNVGLSPLHIVAEYWGKPVSLKFGSQPLVPSSNLYRFSYKFENESTIFAGFPATIAPSGTSFVTTLPAPIIALGPIDTFPTIMLFPPMNTLSYISIQLPCV